MSEVPINPKVNREKSQGDVNAHSAEILRAHEAEKQKRIHAEMLFSQRNVRKEQVLTNKSATTTVTTMLNLRVKMVLCTNMRTTMKTMTSLSEAVYIGRSQCRRIT